MISHRKSLLALLLLTPPILAQEAPSYARQVRPFFARYCVECHTPEDPDGGLSLDSFKGLMAGREHGPVIVPGKPDQSRLVHQIEGKAKPKMPPRKARQPKPDEIAVVRAWVAAGAHDDTGKVGVVLPAILPRRKLAAPVAALAYNPAAHPPLSDR